MGEGKIKMEELSGWRCELFGMGEGMTYRPVVGCVPNRFWRVMQYLIFGNKWVKEKPT